MNGLARNRINRELITRNLINGTGVCQPHGLTRMGNLVKTGWPACQDRKPPQIELSERHRSDLENFVRAHRTGQAVAGRARVVLLAVIEYSNMDIARLVPMDEEAVGLWRRGR